MPALSIGRGVAVPWIHILIIVFISIIVYSNSFNNDFVVDDGIFTVPGEARKLPDQDRVKGLVPLSCESNHLLESRAIGRPGALRFVHELSDHFAVTFSGVLAQSFQLSAYREVVFRLFLG